MRQHNYQIKQCYWSTHKRNTFMPVGIIVFSSDKKNSITRLCKQRTSE